MVILHAHISLVVTEIIRTSFLGLVDVGKVMEIEAFFCKRDGIDRAFSGWIKRHEDAAVFAQDVVDAAHIARGILVEAIVVCIAAIVGTEFLVFPAR